MILIEHNLDVIRNCDFVVDSRSCWGRKEGGYLGHKWARLPTIAAYLNSVTGQYLAQEI